MPSLLSHSMVRSILNTVLLVESTTFLVVLPAVFTLMYVPYQTRAALVYTLFTGLLFTLAALIPSLLHQLRVDYNWRHLIRFLACAGSALFILIAVVANQLSWIVWLQGLLISAALFGAIYLLQRERLSWQKDSAIGDNVNLGELTDIPPELFILSRSKARILIDIEQVTYGDSIGEHLLNQQLRIGPMAPNISSAGFSFAITDPQNNKAYANITNTSLDNQRRFWSSVDTMEQAPCDQRWDISIALESKAPDFIKKLQAATQALCQAQTVKCARKMDIPLYQSLYPLVGFSNVLTGVLTKPANVLVKLIEIVGNQLEITIEHGYTDNKKLRVMRSIALSLRTQTGTIASSNELMNDNPTVSLPHVEGISVPLPYPQCRLTRLQILSSDESPRLDNRLYMTFEKVINSKEEASGDNQTVLTAEFYPESVVVGENHSRPGQPLDIISYIRHQATDLLNHG